MIRINLLPVRASRRQEAVRTELILFGLAAAAVVLALGAFHVAQLARVNSVRAENVVLDQEITRFKEIATEVEQAEALKAELEKKLGVIKQLKANRAGPVHMLEELSLATPEKLQILSLQEERGKIQLEGLAVSNDLISQFLTNLENSEYFDDVYLNTIEQVDKDGVKLKSFSITARLVVPGTTVAAAAPSSAPPAGGKAPAGGGKAPGGAAPAGDAPPADGAAPAPAGAAPAPAPGGAAPAPTPAPTP
jgi:type IV pilus assembly protein PilN